MIPDNIRELVLEAKSEHNDGWTKEIYLKRLEEIKRTGSAETKEFIEAVLTRKS